MKKTAMMLLAALLLAACEKPLVEETAERGNLILQVMQLEQTPFNVESRAAVADRCNRLNFAIYDSEGTRVKQINQQTGDEDFGTASFQLEEGQYRLLVVGHSSSGNPTMTDLSKIRFSNSQGFTDTFLYYSDDVVVTEESQEIPVSLERIVSMCRFVMTDDYPADVAQMRFQYKGGSGAFNAATGLGSVNSTQTLYFDAAEGQKQFDLYTFLHDDEGTIHLQVTAYDADDNILQEREFDVPMERDHITWLTGAFFSGSDSSSSTTITVTVNTDWSGETHLTF